MLNGPVHTFDNGVRVRERHIIDVQRERYSQHNVHEALEEEHFVRAIKELAEGSTYVNVGSAIGYYPILARKLRPDLLVSAYEPLRRHRSYMRDNLKLNGLKASSVKLFVEGLDVEEGAATFSDMNFSSMIERRPQPKALLARVRSYLANAVIPTVTIEKVIVRCGGSIGLLQMDIQGLEREVLAQSRPVLAQGAVKRWLIGTHSESIHESVKESLQGAGYDIVVDIPTPKLQPDGIVYAARAD